MVRKRPHISSVIEKEKKRVHVDFEVARTRMVKEQLIGRGITDERVLRAMNAVPRHLFLDEAFWPRAYSDHPLPIGFNQTISQPYIVALMTQELNLTGGERILEIGTGSGYQSAVLAVLGCTVYTVEACTELSKKAQDILRRLKIDTIHFRVDDGSLGWKEEAPFDGILVTAGAPSVPDTLMAQLAIGGRLVIPVGDRSYQRLIKVVKGETVVEKSVVCDCAFVPLVGQEGWERG